MNIKQTLQNSISILELHNIPSASLDAEVLLVEVLNRNKPYNYNNVNNLKRETVSSICDAPRNDSRNLDKSWLYANNNYELNKKEEKLFNYFINQRKKQKPVAYIINRKEFFGYDFYVDENVLIPRVETEFIIEETLKIINENKIQKNKINLIDIGTGSGCILISILNELKKNNKNKIIHKSFANDISSKAIKISQFNAKKYNLTKQIIFFNETFETFIKTNKSIFQNQCIITANLPYIKKSEYKDLQMNVKKFEPKNALVGGENGLELIILLINLILEIKNNFNPDSYILFEADPDQITRIKLLLKSKLNTTEIRIVKDLRGKNRIILTKIK
ncbi:MAG: peptide chain release factor N(5)-glutamine methyltransferase [Patescibacteria group bacterium]|nr:peptide chain release factor N(5)-glutamine methyltransferase [Patescibacteria group bacterium]